MNVIYKYPLMIKDHQIIQLTEGFSVMTVKEVNGELCLYSVVNPDIKQFVPVEIFIVGTGHKIEFDVLDPYQFHYMGTVVMTDGLVWHVFMKKRRV